MENITFKEILKGTRPGRLQSVGVMQVIPLLGDIEFKQYVAPQHNGTVGTSGYGNMVFQNTTTDKTMIIPSNVAYIDKKWGQDHAMTHAGIVAARSQKAYNSAICIQQTRGGAIPQGDHDYTIMPFSLREVVSTTRKQTGFGRHWPDITRFNQKLGLKESAGHLEYFFDHYGKQLDEFVAEFESVKGQIGAIILINGAVVGIERAPNHDFWKAIWEKLIRGCYSSLAIMATKEKDIDTKVIEKTRVQLPLDKINSIDDLDKILADTESKQMDIVSAIVKEVLDLTFKVELDETLKKDQRINVQTADFKGQIITDGEAVVYASIISGENSYRNRKVKKAKEFTI